VEYLAAKFSSSLFFVNPTMQLKADIFTAICEPIT
jgi:hypothetical protein